MSSHSKFSASGMERIEACPGSVELSATQPDRTSPWAEEGTKAHKVLELTIQGLRCDEPFSKQIYDAVPDVTIEMFGHAKNAAQFIIGLFDGLSEMDGQLLMVETKVTLDWIHPDLGGTFDAAIVDPFGTLHVFDYKYGAGVPVSPVKNLQMVVYGMGLAHLHGWNFHTIRHWIIQPRIKGYDGPLFWDVPVPEMKGAWVRRIASAVGRAIKSPDVYIEGPHCHWCKAKTVCPLKLKEKRGKAMNVWG